MTDFNEKLKKLEKKIRRQRIVLLILTLILLPPLLFFGCGLLFDIRATCNGLNIFKPRYIVLESSEGYQRAMVSNTGLHLFQSHHLYYGGLERGRLHLQCPDNMLYLNKFARK